MPSLVDSGTEAQNSRGFLSWLKRIPIAVVFSFVLLIWVVARTIFTEAQPQAGIAAALVAIGSFSGYIAGGTIAQKVDNAIDRDTQRLGGSRLIRSIGSGLDVRYDSFLSFTAITTVFYVGMYFEAIRSFQAEPGAVLGLAVNPLIILITFITIFFMSLFSVRYASYVRMTKCLEALIRATSKLEISLDGRAVMTSVRDVVFRDSQLFEPAGNVFVTVGITATFLGLAVALIGLDLPGLVASGTRSTASLSAFVACMGLALGMSMVGVMTALAAQWLRGYGAGESTEDLLARADRCLALETPPPAGADNAPSGPAG